MKRLYFAVMYRYRGQPWAIIPGPAPYTKEEARVTVTKLRADNVDPRITYAIVPVMPDDCIVEEETVNVPEA